MKLQIILHVFCIQSYNFCLVLMKDRDVIKEKKYLFFAWKISRLMFTTERFNYNEIYVDYYEKITNKKNDTAMSCFSITHNIIIKQMKKIYDKNVYNKLLESFFNVKVKNYIHNSGELFLRKKEKYIMKRIDGRIPREDRRYAELMIKIHLMNYIDTIIQNNLLNEIFIDVIIGLNDMSASGFYFKQYRLNNFEYFETTQLDRRYYIITTRFEYSKMKDEIKKYGDICIFLYFDIFNILFELFLEYHQKHIDFYKKHHKLEGFNRIDYEDQFKYILITFGTSLNKYLFNIFSCIDENEDELQKLKNFIRKNCDNIYRQSDAQLKVILNTILYYFFEDCEKLIDMCVEYIKKQLNMFYADFSFIFCLDDQDRRIMIYLL